MAIFNGTAARDIYNGTSSADTARGNGGDDTLSGLGGGDALYGDSGNDGLYGGTGIDRIFGGTGVDALFGQDGADQLYGEAGNDWLQGGAGNDYLHGGSGNDSLRGDDGDDTLNGAVGDNDLRGGAGNDTLIHSGIGPTYSPTVNAFYDGGSGHDTLLIDYWGDYIQTSTDFSPWVEININPDASSTMNYSSDPLEGPYEIVAAFAGIEEFRLTGETGRLSVTARTDAVIFGNDERDKLEGRQGDQDFTGGGGADEYQFYWRKGFEPNHDTVHGFSVAEGDTIAFGNQSENDLDEPLPLDITAEEVNGHTIYTSVEIATGQVVHTLDVDAVGLPEPQPWYYLG
ncbi:Ca2+-binding RTX toxin-like protein [Skermanella aerolata]|uniref:calcium-binding protein n=1 Tax=Skermanella aerolata TaxID=393310 RepID=UPI003D1E46FF